MKSIRVWAEVSSQLSSSKWWPEFCRAQKISEEYVVEKWKGSELSWPRLTDSLRSFTLFSRQKVILVQDADKALKKDKSLGKLLAELEQGPHHLVFQAESSAPKAWPFKSWKGPEFTENLGDEKAVFKWIDAIQNQNLKLALTELDRALLGGQHPLVFLQLIARHYRMGRLIHHALAKGLTEAEILGVLKLPSFAFQKWARSRRISTRQWQRVFERLQWADWQMKSGFEAIWILRKLSFDLIEISQNAPKPKLSAQPNALFQNSFLNFARV